MKMFGYVGKYTYLCTAFKEMTEKKEVWVSG